MKEGVRKIFLALGNPGLQYRNTRHNVGCLFLDFWAQKEGWKWQKKGEIYLLKKEKIILAKSAVFMNESGKAVARLRQEVDFELTHFCLVHDELDLPLGSWKLSWGRSSPLHKGVLSVEKHLGTSEFWRLRLGVDNRLPEKRIAGEKYVLQNFASGEEEILFSVFEKIQPQQFDLSF